MFNRTIPFLILLVFLVTASSAMAQKSGSIDQKWSKEAKKALQESPLTVSKEVFSEIRDTWALAVTPALKRVCGEDAAIRTTLGIIRDDIHNPCFVLTARGSTKAKTRRPAYESTRARTVPLRSVEMRIYLNQPEVLEQRKGECFDITTAITNGKPLMEIKFAGDRSVRQTRPDGNTDSVDWSVGDRYLRVTANSSSGTADALAIATMLQNACNTSRWYEFPGFLRVIPVKPPIPTTPPPLPIVKKPAVQPAGNVGDGPSDTMVKVRLTTSMGDIVLALNETKAPLSVANFLQYVDDEYYDGTIFHRVMSNFMIQGGGLTPSMTKKATRPAIRNEWQNGLKNARGSIAMARTNVPDSATSQFFINVVDNPALDQPQGDGAAYAVFGKVIEGLDVVDNIRYTQVGTRSGRRNVPLQTVLIEKIRRVKAPATATSKPARDPSDPHYGHNHD